MATKADIRVDRKGKWQAPERPAWLAAMIAEGAYLELQATLPLDADSLLHAARSATGLTDFGDGHWREGFEVYTNALEEEAELHLLGRLMMRNDILIWLKNRLQITELLKRHPDIARQPIEKPMFIVGLPRSGTSILFEVLAEDPACGVPSMWEAMLPYPPPTADTYTTDERIALADGMFTLWNRAVPEFATMHEMAGDIPAECGLLMAASFNSDHNLSLAQIPSYAAWQAQADITPTYEYHRTMLQVLQWKNPRERWLLKAPAHQNHLDTLLKIYPDARIIQTHRDPIKCMASATSLMGCLYWMRSNKTFDSDAFQDFLTGEAAAQRLEHVMQQREAGIVPEENICDSRYQDLMDDPMTCVDKIYRHFGMSLSKAARQRMLDYLDNKPKGKFGAHRYEVGEDEVGERRYFQRYQEAYDVPNEV